MADDNVAIPLHRAVAARRRTPMTTPQRKRPTPPQTAAAAAAPHDATVPRAARRPRAEEGSKAAGRRGIQSIETGFAILEVMRRAGGPIALSRIAEGAQLTVANTHYDLVSFQNIGLVQQDGDTGHYGLGAYALKLGVAALEQFDVYKLARPAMAAISEQTGLTVFLGVWGNKGPAIVYRAEGGKSLPLLELRLGSVLPLLSSALGLNFFAHLPVEMTAGLLEDELRVPVSASGLARSDACRTREQAMRLREEIRSRGVSRCQDTRLPNFTSLSAPIFDLSGGIIAALTVMGPSRLLEGDAEAEVLGLLQRSASEISQTAGMYA